MSELQGVLVPAVYTCAARWRVESALQAGGSGTLHEGKPWVTGRKLLDETTPFDKLPLLLSDAIGIARVEWVADIDDIVVSESSGTAITFSRLVPVSTHISLSDLLKYSNREPLGASIRPYTPVLLSSRVAKALRQRDTPIPEPRPTGLGAEGAWSEIEADPKCAGLPETERRRLVNARLGQGGYRTRLLELWKGRCALSRCKLKETLVASHAKAWSDSSNHERLDEFNGLLLVASVDKLFDGGLIAFDDEGALLVASEVSDEDLTSMGLHRAMRLSAVHPRHVPYLASHREKHGF